MSKSIDKKHLTIPATEHSGKPENSAVTYRWLILLVTTSAQATITLISAGVGTIGPFLTQDLNLSKSQLGFIGGAVNVGMALASLIAGRAVDYWGEKKVLIVGGLATGLSVLLTSTAQTFIPLLGFLLLTGLWASTSNPAGSKGVMTWFPYSQRALALGIRQTGAPLGGMIAALVLPLIAVRWGWRMAMVAMFLGTVIGATVCLLGYKEYPEKLAKPPSREKGSWRQLLLDRNIIRVGLAGMAYLSLQYILITYMVLYLHETTGLAVETASLFLALVQLGGLFGRPFWGYASDTFFKGRRKPVLMLIGGITFVLALLMLLLSRETPLVIVGSLAALIGFTGLGWNGVHITMLSEIAGKERSGTAVGIGMTLTQIGVLIFPPIFGLLIDLNQGKYTLSWLALSGLVLAGILIFYRAEERGA